jgi:hypothetical protein
MLQISNSTQNIKTFTCETCAYTCIHISNYNKHLLTQKHKKNIEEINNFPQNHSKNIQKYSHYNCSQCNYFTKKMSEFSKHTNTLKHKNNINLINTLENLPKYNCKHCEKEYSKKNSCAKHEKICILNNSINEPLIITSTPEIPNNNDIINRLIQENQELRLFMTEQSKEFMKTITDLAKNNNSTTVNGNVNSNNTNKFNINLFLNEKCKDAINFSDFIKNIEVSHEDLENNAQLGFANGISKILMDNLKQLSIYDRPIHCSDVKRETMYIKDENKWANEEDTKKLTNAIQDVSRKSVASLLEWQETNPEFEDMDSDFSNNFITMMQQSMAGNKRDALYPKVIRSLAKETMIDKAN